MTTDQPDLGYRLEELERRWAQSPDRTVLLQLAEEYGRHHRWLDAARVLEEGLQRHPDHLAARVALGRSYLRSGYAAEACRMLEPVIATDPMHLVANKLLVEAYLDTGQVPRARDRLDLYSLLNGTDTDLERLDSEVRSAEQGTRPRPAPPELPEAFAQAAATRSDTPFATLAEADLGPAPTLASLGAIGRLDRGRSGLFGASGSDPFGELLDAVGDRATADLGPDNSRYGLISLVGTGGAVAAAAGAAWAGSVVGGAAEATTGAMPRETVEEARVEARDPIVPEETSASDESPAVSVASSTDEVSAVEAATVTMGRLYLDQGQNELAEQTFRAVLQAEPGRDEARDGLAEARRRQGWELRAEHLLEGAQAGGTEARRELLTRYLAAIRGRDAASAPS